MKKTLKIMIAFLAVAAIVLAFAACGKKTEPEPEVNDGQNPVMNFIGVYAADRCTITVAADGENDAKITASWGQSATETYEYTMSGLFDIDTLRVNYSNGEKKYVVYDENGEVAQETVEYTDGVGRVVFHEDGTLEWQDEQEADKLIGTVFTLVPVEGDAIAGENEPVSDDAASEAVSESGVSEAVSTAVSTAASTAAATAADEARAALSEAIAGARSYYDEIKDNASFAEFADDLDTRLQRAEALLASSTTTAQELQIAASDVAAALTAAKDLVSAASEEG